MPLGLVDIPRDNVGNQAGRHSRDWDGCGGSALFFASICDLLGKGEVITIDIIDRAIPPHPRITKITGNSVSDKVIDQVGKIVGKKNAMVVLDSAHEKAHVLREMELYSEFVSVGNYLIVEDTNINGHLVYPGWGAGPMEAVEEFLRNRKDFEIDRTREKFLLTFNPKGFLRRIKP
jgi:cephalosporin hydroxylase